MGYYLLTIALCLVLIVNDFDGYGFRIECGMTTLNGLLPTHYYLITFAYCLITIAYCLVLTVNDCDVNGFPIKCGMTTLKGLLLIA